MSGTTSFCSILKDYSQISSLNGPAQLASATNKCWRCLWIVFILGTTGYMSWQLYDLFDTYYSWPVSTKVTLGFSPQSLPAVSICNMNRVKKSKVGDVPELLKIVKEAQEAAVEIYSDFKTNSEEEGDDSAPENSTAANTTTDDDEDDDGDEFEDFELWEEDVISDFLKITPASDEYKRRQRWKYHSQQDVENRHAIGHQIDDMLVQCTFGNKLCSKDDFEIFWSADYGNCYTINKPSPRIRTSGENTGFSLILNIEKEENIGLLETGYGIRLTIHEHDSIPFPAEDGITLSAGQETYIGLKIIQMERMSEPYGNCVDGVQYRSKAGIKYSIAACQKFCLRREILKACQCDGRSVIADLETIFEFSDWNTGPATRDCEVEDGKLSRRAFRKMMVDSGIISVEVAQYFVYCGGCVGDVLNDHYSGEGVCHNECGSKCKETIYSRTISSRLWPSDEYMKKLQEELCETTPDGAFCDRDDEEDFSTESKQAFGNTFLKVKIYFQDLNYETITEEPVYEPVRFLSDIGGTLGLFIGASLLSLVEILCLVVELMHHAARRLFGSKLSNVRPSTPERKVGEE